MEEIRLWRKLESCEECKASNHPFVYDYVHAHYSCTNCGLVYHSIHKSDITYEHRSHISAEPVKKPIANAEATVEPCQRKVFNELLHAEQKQENMTIFKWERKRGVLEENLEKLAFKFDCPTTTIDRALRLVKRNFNSLKEHEFENPNRNILKLRGIENTALCLLVIVTQMSGRSLSVRMAQQFTNKKNLNKQVRKICRMLHINIASVAMARLKNVCSALNLPFKTSKVVERVFRQLKKKHQNIGEETLLALSFYKVMIGFTSKQKLVGTLVEVIGINKNTLSKYMNLVS